MSRPAVTARNVDGQVLFLGTLPKGVTFPDLPGALCKSTSDPELFFPGHGNRAAADRAKAICAACPARVPCLKWGVQYEQDGVWGGTTPRERAQIRRVQRERLKQAKARRTASTSGAKTEAAA